MSVKPFGEFCQLLSRGKWSQKDKDSIELTAKARPDYLTRKLAEDFCVTCVEYCNGKYCPKCKEVSQAYISSEITEIGVYTTEQ